MEANAAAAHFAVMSIGGRDACDKATFTIGNVPVERVVQEQTAFTKDVANLQMFDMTWTNFRGI